MTQIVDELFRVFAEAGARLRVAELERELEQIYATFPTLGHPLPPSEPSREMTTNGDGNSATQERRRHQKTQTVKPRRRKLSANGRARIAAAQRKRWKAFHAIKAATV